MAVSYYRDWESFYMSSAPGDCPVAFCGDLRPASLLGAYRRGIVPFPAHDEYSRNIDEFQYEDKVAEGVIAIVGSDRDDPYSVAWWSPDPRLIMSAENVHVGRHVRKSLRRGPGWTTTADHAFQRVAEECRRDREPRWLTDRLLEGLIELHRMGWAHSIEVWEGPDLVGGAFGIGIGTTFSGDSMFNRRPNAARVAVADLAARLAQAGGAAIDAQWDSPFLRSLGAEPVPRAHFLQILEAGYPDGWRCPGRSFQPGDSSTSRPRDPWPGGPLRPPGWSWLGRPAGPGSTARLVLARPPGWSWLGSRSSSLPCCSWLASAAPSSCTTSGMP